MKKKSLFGFSTWLYKSLIVLCSLKKKKQQTLPGVTFMSFTIFSPTHFGKINKTGSADHCDHLSDTQGSKSSIHCPKCLNHRDKSVSLPAVWMKTLVNTTLFESELWQYFPALCTTSSCFCKVISFTSCFALLTFFYYCRLVQSAVVTKFLLGYYCRLNK